MSFFLKMFYRIIALFSVVLLKFTIIFPLAAQERGLALEEMLNSKNSIHIAYRKQNIALSFYKGISNTESQIHSALFSGLLSSDAANLNINANLAVSWFSSEDETVYTFHLRNNALFSDGSKITATDVRRSWLAILEHDSAFSYLLSPIEGVSAYLQGNADIESIGIAALTENTLQVKLEQANSDFLKIITHSVFSVTKAAQIEIDNWESSPYSIPFSGPYILAARDEKYMILKKNPQHWARNFVQTQYVIIHFYDYTEDEQLLQDIAAGKIHWSTAYAEAPNPAWMHVNQIFGTSYLFFKTANEPWNNENIRTAIRKLIPFDTLRKDLYQFPATSLVPQLYNTYQAPEISYEKNVTEALELLKNAKFPNGKGLPQLVILVSSHDGTYSELFDEIKSSVETHTDIAVELKPLSSHKYYEALVSEDYDIGSYSWIGDYLSPTAFFQMWLSPNKALGHDYDSAEYREAFMHAVSIQDEQQIRNAVPFKARSLPDDNDFTNFLTKNAALQKTENILLEDTVVIPLHHLFAVNIVRTDLIEGWNSNILDHHQFALLRKKTSPLVPFITLLQ